MVAVHIGASRRRYQGGVRRSLHCSAPTGGLRPVCGRIPRSIGNTPNALDAARWIRTVGKSAVTSPNKYRARPQAIEHDFPVMMHGAAFKRIVQFLEDAAGRSVFEGYQANQGRQSQVQQADAGQRAGLGAGSARYIGTEVGNQRTSDASSPCLRTSPLNCHGGNPKWLAASVPALLALGPFVYCSN